MFSLGREPQGYERKKEESPGGATDAGGGIYMSRRSKWRSRMPPLQMGDFDRGGRALITDHWAGGRD